ncbi:glycerophosphodiester phosphodiesterase family protein [Flexithrix dorotheae]|uniref:glycerophosphodiester phosphodiesterase family protein n=1 Tax=Flexithrix dorotheae TaxID=70993 RepID=UPI001FDFE1A4|nr:glycerophosphodiester phosphodiesterase family protein [Flexithrix dorotheae]
MKKLIFASKQSLKLKFMPYFKSCLPVIILVFFFAANLNLANAQTFNFDLQGHRGARGLMPENTIPSFLEALKLDVNTLELDVVISKDKKVVVSHEPWFNPSICLDASGNQITEESEKKIRIYEMDYAEILQFDCGSTQNPQFPKQQTQKVAKPLLEDVISTVEAYIKNNNLPKVAYNIEIKSAPKGDDTFHPTIDVFSKLVHKVIKKQLPTERVTIQSFDFRVLKYWNKHYPAFKLSALVSGGDIKNQIDKLGFTPQIYSPSFKYLDQNTVKQAQTMGMKVIPWTVNQKEEMIPLLEWGVDGIITDYPDIGMELKK